MWLEQHRPLPSGVPMSLRKDQKKGKELASVPIAILIKDQRKQGASLLLRQVALIELASVGEKSKDLEVSPSVL